MKLAAIAILLLIAPAAWAQSQILYTNTVSAASNVYVMNSDGTNVRQVSPSGSQGPAEWSKDGKQVAFTNNGLVYRINVDGTGLTQLSPNGAQDTSPDWSPDDSTIIFTRITSTSPSNVGSICTMNAVTGYTGTPTCIFAGGTTLNDAAHYNPANQSQIAFESNAWCGGANCPFQIYTCNPSSCIGTATEISPTGTFSQAADEHWNLAGTLLVVSGLTGGGSGNLNVWSMTSTGASPTNLTNLTCPAEGGDPDYGPDGRIAFEWDNGTGSGPCVYQSNNAIPTFVYTMAGNGAGAASTGQACNNVGCSPRPDPVAAGVGGSNNIKGIGMW